MASDCLDINLHNNSGTSQEGRTLQALSYDYAHVDERSVADLLLFAKKYGKYLNFYNAGNSIAGDWSSFMSKDISVIIASLNDWNGKDYITYINNQYDKILASSTIPDAQTNFKYIFDLIFSLADNLNGILWQLPSDSDFATYLSTVITSKLSTSVNQFYVYYPYFLSTILSGININTTDALSPFDDTISIPTNTSTFQTMFSFIGNQPWTLPVNTIIPPTNVFSGDSVSDIVTNNFFTGTITSFLNGIVNIINQSGNYLDKTISYYPAHTPHYALYLSFIRLFGFAQKHLNDYTKRHLDFYYKKVLQLKNNNGLPDVAHLVFTLQKNIAQHLLPKGTQFKSGKDVNGNNLFYSLTDDIVINQAGVEEIKSLFILKNYNNASAIIPQQLFASPVANSSDGQGAALTSAEKSWNAFGDISNPAFPSKSIANVGFAIASHILFLNEGKRIITLTFTCDASSKNTLANLGSLPFEKVFSAKFTGNKNWFYASDYSDTSLNVVANANATQSQFKVAIVLNGDAPPIVPYSQKIHDGNFVQALPMVQILLNDYRFYSTIKLLKIISVDISISAFAVKNLSLQNDAGKLDGSKPFKPFGDFPDDGAAFIIGSKEIFQKKLNKLDINFSWQTAPVIGTLINATALSKGNLQTNSPFDSSVNIIQNVVQLSGLNGIPQAPADFSPNGNYTLTSVNGFIQLILTSPSHYYSLSNYLQGISSSILDVTSAPDSTNPNQTDYTVKPPSPTPVAPTIIAQSISIDYSATETIDLSTTGNFNTRSDFFYHIEPFGFREMHPFLFTGLSQKDATLQDNQIHVLPVFDMDNDAQESSDNGTISAYDNEGELWFGLNNTTPGETHSILFQVSEGSSNPLKNITQISWFYLSSNNWIAFDTTTQIDDQTNSLSQSGLIVFNLPGNETVDNTRADKNLLWIKGVVKKDTDAVCKIISIQANTAKAQFDIVADAGIYFTQNIPASTITKPAIADAALKQTTQPYPSFGGVPKETDIQFNQRISERLRHKHRAVTAWDYERLILQNFPNIHKVKCINHTNINIASQQYSEMKPGDVMIVTVPDLSLVTGANPLLPFTNTGLLEDIKKFIMPYTSPFVNISVCNPQFEAVQFISDVHFINNNENSSFYAQQLNTDLLQFLMPWTFGTVDSDIEFGGKIEKSVALNFVQTRPYVDFVTEFKMIKYIYREDGTFSSPTPDSNEAIASTARSILVPYNTNIISPTANCGCNE